MWCIDRPRPDSGLSVDQRVITIGKSRIGREGERLIQTQNEDLTLSLVEAKRTEELQTRAGTVAERIMNRLQTNQQPMSKAELDSDPLVGGSVAAIKKTLQRLVNRGVVEVVEERGVGKRGKSVFRYSAVRAHGERSGNVPLEQIPSYDREVIGDTRSENQKCPPYEREGRFIGDNSAPQEKCPPLDPSAGAGSAPLGTGPARPRAREALSAMLDTAVSQWDD
jgi:predicted transcriptional regulator